MNPPSKIFFSTAGSIHILNTLLEMLFPVSAMIATAKTKKCWYLCFFGYIYTSAGYQRLGINAGMNTGINQIPDQTSMTKAWYQLDTSTKTGIYLSIRVQHMGMYINIHVHP